MNHASVIDIREQKNKARQDCYCLLKGEILTETHLEQVKEDFRECLDLTDIPPYNGDIEAILEDKRRNGETRTNIVYKKKEVLAVPHSAKSFLQEELLRVHHIDDYDAYQLAMKSTLNLDDSKWKIEYVTLDHSLMEIAEGLFVEIREIEDIEGKDTELVRRIIMKSGAVYESPLTRKVLKKIFKRICKCTAVIFLEYANDKHLAKNLSLADLIHLEPQKFSEKMLRTLNKEGWLTSNNGFTRLVMDFSIVHIFEKISKSFQNKTYKLLLNSDIPEEKARQLSENIIQLAWKTIHEKMGKKWGAKWLMKVKKLSKKGAKVHR